MLCQFLYVFTFNLILLGDLTMKQSTIPIKYVYERVYDILDNDNQDMSYMLSRFLDELALNYKTDTGKTINL